jgi:hypothetical protein
VGVRGRWAWEATCTGCSTCWSSTPAQPRRACRATVPPSHTPHLHRYLVGQQAQALEAAVDLLLLGAARGRLPEVVSDQVPQVCRAEAAAGDALCRPGRQCLQRLQVEGVPWRRPPIGVGLAQPDTCSNGQSGGKPAYEVAGL